MKEFRKELKNRAISFLAWLLIQAIGRTTCFKVSGFDGVQKLVKSGRGFIMAIWHGRTMMPVYYCRGMGIWAITSLSRDGEYQTRIISRFGYQIIRGSTGRGGIKAALTACKKLDEGGILSITPDGPKGPPNEVQDGVIFMSQRASCPIIPIGVGLSRRKIMNAWDSYALPGLFGRCAIIFGDPVFPPADDSEEQSIAVRDELKKALDDVQHQAQLIAGEGK
ncbi:MAG: lysophospholipid acyltransferase family protein [Armatimonadota bacterium]